MQDSVVGLWIHRYPAKSIEVIQIGSSDVFVRSLGFDPALFRPPDARIPVETHFRIQDQAVNDRHDAA